MNYRYGVVTAVTWRLVAEFIRRHGSKADFNIMELHPCSGMYDCLSIFINEGTLPGLHLFDFNQGSGNLHIFGVWDKPRKTFEEVEWPGGNSYVGAFLSEADTSRVIDDMEALIGMPSYSHNELAKATPKVLMLRIIAGLLQRHALGREIIDVRNVIHESEWGTSIRDELLNFAKVKEQIPGQGNYESMTRAALNFWLVIKAKSENMSSNEAKAVIDFKGGVYLSDTSEIYWDVWKEYQGGRSVTALVSKLDKYIMTD